MATKALNSTCPLCGQPMKKIKEIDTITRNSVLYSAEKEKYQCLHCKEKFTTTEQDSDFFKSINKVILANNPFLLRQAIPQPCFIRDEEGNLVENPEYNDDFRYSGTYLHGELEQEFGYDIFALDRAIQFPEGIWLIQREDNRRMMLFLLWNDDQNGFRQKESDEKHRILWRGYLIYADDYESVEHCTRAFNRRESTI